MKQLYNLCFQQFNTSDLYLLFIVRRLQNIVFKQKIRVMLCLLLHNLLLGIYSYIIRTYLLYKVYLIVTLIV